MRHRTTVLSMAMATIVLVSMVAAAGVSAAKPATVGGPVTGAPAATSDGTNVWLVAQGASVASGNIYYKIGGGAWSAPLGTGTNPCIVALGVGTVDIFWVSTSGALVGRTTANGGATWTAITLLPSQVAAGTGPAATYNAGQVDVFYVNSGSNALMWDSLPANVNNMQQNLGGIVTASPGAVVTNLGIVTASPGVAAPAPTTGSIDVFVRGSTGALYEKLYAMGGFGGWTKFHDGVLAAGTGPTAVAGVVAVAGTPTTTTDNVYLPLTSNVFLFVKGTTGNLYELYSNDGGFTWNTVQPSGHALGWINLGGVLKSSPSVATAAPLPTAGVVDALPFSHIVVVVRGGDGGIWTKTGSSPYIASSDWSWSTTSIAGP